MKLFILIISMVLGASLNAREVKPAGTILSTYCGNENRTFYICVESADVGTKTVNFITRTNGLKKTKEFFTVVSTETSGKATKYTGYYQAKEDKYTVAKSYVLIIETLNNGKITAQVVDNGVKGRAFEAKMIMHTL